MLSVGDALAHRALEALVRAESSVRRQLAADLERRGLSAAGFSALVVLTTAENPAADSPRDRKSTRLNSSHRCISCGVFCLKKKKIAGRRTHLRGQYVVAM